MPSDASGQIATRFGANLKRARDERNWTQRELAVRLDVDQMAISRWENGHGLPSQMHVAAVATEFERDIGWFYADQAKAGEAA